jgi:hypothetical protein
MVGHNPDHDKDPITQAMVRAMKDEPADDPLVKEVLSNYATLKMLVAQDPSLDPDDEIGRYEYLLARWKSS